MSETETLFAALRQSSDESVVDMLERMVRDAPDHALNNMNALDLAGTHGIDEERVIAALLIAVGLRSRQREFQAAAGDHRVRKRRGRAPDERRDIRDHSLTPPRMSLRSSGLQDSS
jgi:hypothetical protein